MGQRIPHLTRRCALKGCAAVLAAGSGARSATAERAGIGVELEAELARQGVVGTFAHLDLQTDRMTLANPARAAQRFIPASTFKIVNALIALETGAVADETEVIPWGGHPQPISSWEKDMTLGAAMSASNVPVFQEVARRIGIKRYEHWLDRLDYGNGRVGQVVDRFWLDGPLRISAIEQASFLAPLALRQLPMSKRSQEIVAGFLNIESRGGRTLYAKTGWCTATEPQIGWWVGWVDGANRLDTFALNIDMGGASDGPRRVAAGKSMLAALDLY